MPEASGIHDLNSPVVAHARKDFPLLDADITIAEALDQIRREGIGERVIYFFAIDADKKLVGVLPTRRLLTATPETRLRDIMVRRVVAIPATATVLDACEFFVLYKFFAFPVVDEQRRVVGVVDVSLFAEEILGEGDEQARPAAPAARDDVFEALGFHLEQIRGASPFRVFRFRFPWLLVTVAGGTICAIVSGAFEATLAHSLVIAFFLTMVLGLNESVSAQSMSVTIQMLRSAPVTWRLVRDCPAPRTRHRGLNRGRLRKCGRRDRVCLAARCSRRCSDRREHRAFARDRILVWTGRSFAFASVRSRSKNRRRSGDAGARRHLRACFVFHNCAAGFVMSNVSVVIPALNEEEPIAAVVQECLATGIPSEVVVVDNGSTDSTAERAKQAGARVVSEPKPGYGRACAAGVRAVSPESEIIVFLDGDGSDCPEFMSQLVDPIAAGTA